MVSSPPPLPRDADLITLLQRICETPAPTFAEAARAALVKSYLETLGFKPEQDEVGNVFCKVPGGCGPRLLLAAHLDTVFDADTDVTLRQEGNRLAAPGIGDNSASLAVLLYFLRQLKAEQSYPQLTFAATVGEEGLGDLRGMRQLMRTHAPTLDGVIAIDGHLGTIVQQAVGSIRYVVRFQAQGGHSWGDFPSPSATHALGEAIYSLNKLPTGKSPRSSYNIGSVWGGGSINSIAQEAGFSLDLRSVDSDMLAFLADTALQRIRKVANRQGVSIKSERVGNRPAVQVPSRGLVQAAKHALNKVGYNAAIAASSTDANAALAAGLPAIAFGVYRGGDAHKLSEWLEPNSLETGYHALVLLLQELSQLTPQQLARGV